MAIEEYTGIWYEEKDDKIFRCYKSNKPKRIKFMKEEFKFFYGLFSFGSHPLYGGSRKFFLRKEISDRVGTKLSGSLVDIIEKTTGYELRDANTEYTFIRNQWLDLNSGKVGEELDKIMKSSMKYDEIKNPHTKEPPVELIALGIMGIFEFIDFICNNF